MSLLNGFNAADVEPSTGGSLVPEGWYLASITDSEEKSNKAGTGKYLELEFTIDGPSYANRRVWARLNLQHPNEMTVDIARRDLSAICRAVGVLQPRSPEDLYGRPLQIKVIVQPGKNGYSDSNEVKGYLSPSEAQEPAVAAPAARRGPAPKLQDPDDDLPF